jgi:UDP-glucose:glycoprotein glucosyltransferase
MESLMALGLKTADAIGVLTHQDIMKAHESRPTLENLFDASDRTEGGNVIVWWNDLEADSRYFLP